MYAPNSALATEERLAETACLGGADPNQWVEYALDRPRLMNGYQFATTDGECPVAWSLEAS